MTHQMSQESRRRNETLNVLPLASIKICVWTFRCISFANQSSWSSISIACKLVTNADFSSIPTYWNGISIRCPGHPYMQHTLRISASHCSAPVSQAYTVMGVIWGALLEIPRLLPWWFWFSRCYHFNGKGKSPNRTWVACANTPWTIREEKYSSYVFLGHTHSIAPMVMCRRLSWNESF